MASVSLTIALTSNAKVKCDVSVDHDEFDSRTWRRFGWSIGGLKFGPLPGNAATITSGVWIYYAPHRELYLLDTGENIIYGTAKNVPSDFLTAVTCGHSLAFRGEFWHQGGYRQTDWSCWFGCA